MTKLFEGKVIMRMQEMAGLNVELPVDVGDKKVRGDLLVYMNANELKVVFDRIQQSFALKIIEIYKDEPNFLKSIIVPPQTQEPSPMDRPELNITFMDPGTKVKDVSGTFANKLDVIESKFISLVRASNKISDEAKKFKQDALVELFKAAFQWGVPTLRIITRVMGETILHTSRRFNSMQELEQYILSEIVKNPTRRFIGGYH